MYDRHMLLSEILTLLLIQYKCFIEKNNFKI